MMINPIGPTASVPTSSTDKPSSTLGKDDFLKLLAEQLRQQDPMNATDNDAFMAQMTQFSILEQITNVSSSQQAAAAAAATSQLISAIGRTVTYVDADGVAQTGVVEGVKMTTDGNTLTISGVEGISPTAVTGVQ